MLSGRGAYGIGGKTMREQVKRQRAKLIVGGMMSAAVIGWGVAGCSHDDHDRCVDQEFSPLPSFSGSDGGGRAVLGAWLVDGEPAGLGIRESDGLVTDTYARFVPHVIDG